MYMQCKNGMGGMGFLDDVDWEGLLKGAVSAYGAYKVVDVQSDLAKAQIEAQQQAGTPFFNYGYNYPTSPVYSSVPASSSTLNSMMPILLIGGLALAAFFILKK